MADAAFLTFLSALCAREFAATQYALLSSVPKLAIHTIGGVSGVMAASLGWTLFYVVCMAGALPGMVLMVLLLRRERRSPGVIGCRRRRRPAIDGRRRVRWFRSARSPA